MRMKVSVGGHIELHGLGRDIPFQVRPHLRHLPICVSTEQPWPERTQRIMSMLLHISVKWVRTIRTSCLFELAGSRHRTEPLSKIWRFERGAETRWRICPSGD